MAHCLRDWVLPRRAVIGTGTGPIISIHQRLILVVPPIAANVPRVVLAVSDSEHTWTVFPSPPYVFYHYFLLYGAIQCLHYNFEVRLLKYLLDLIRKIDQ